MWIVEVSYFTITDCGQLTSSSHVSKWTSMDISRQIENQMTSSRISQVWLLSFCVNGSRRKKDEVMFRTISTSSGNWQDKTVAFQNRILRTAFKLLIFMISVSFSFIVIDKNMTIDHNKLKYHPQGRARILRKTR